MKLKLALVVSSLLWIAAAGMAEEKEEPAIQFKSDVRFRDEVNSGRVLNEETEIKEDIAQNKIRLRLRSEMVGNINEFFRAGFRMVTGSAATGNKHSTHVDANTHFEKLPLAIDRAYLDILVNSELVLHLGKFGNPFMSSGIYNELIWDADIQPEGLALSFDHATEENDWVKSGGFVASLYLLENMENGKDPAFLTAEQAFITLPVKKIMEVTLASGAYFFFNSHPEGQTQYQIWDTFFKIKLLNTPVPFLFKGQWIYNWMTDHDNMGYVLGASVNEVKKLGDVSASYHGSFIDENAVDPEYAQDDFARAADLWGHEVALKVGLAQKVNLNFRMLFTNWQRDLNYFRGRLEFNAKF